MISVTSLYELADRYKKKALAEKDPEYLTRAKILEDIASKREAPRNDCTQHDNCA